MASRYQIRVDGEVFADNMQTDYAFYDGKLQEQINTAGTLTFTVLAQNPKLSDVKIRKSTVSLYRKGVEIWRGSVVKSEIDFYNRRRLTCEGVLSWLYDCRQATFTASGTAANTLISNLLTAYNNLCSPNRKILLGDVQSTAAIRYNHTGEYLTFFEIFAEILQTTGGYYRIRYDSGNVYLDLLNMPTEASGQEVHFGQNLLDFVRYIDASKIITAIYATGGSSTSYSLTDPIIDTEFADAFGLIYGYEHFENATSNSNLKSLATDFLAKNILYEATITVTATDLNMVDDEQYPFEVGQLVKVVSIPHNLKTNILLTALETDLNNPASSSITLGDAQMGLTKYVKGNIKKGKLEIYRVLENAYNEGVNSI